MYIPKSLRTNILNTSKGKFKFKKSGLDFEGEYYVLSNKKIYSKNNEELELINKGEKIFDVINNIPKIKGIKEIIENKYNSFKNFKSENLINKINPLINKGITANHPITFIPFPTENDYNNGFFIRYFIKKLNTDKINIKEISFNDYNSMNSFLYQKMEIKWYLTNIKNIISTPSQLNENTIMESENIMRGIIKILNPSEFIK